MTPIKGGCSYINALLPIKTKQNNDFQCNTWNYKNLEDFLNLKNKSLGTTFSLLLTGAKTSGKFDCDK